MDEFPLHFPSPNKNMFEQIRIFMGKLPIVNVKKAHKEFAPMYAPSALSTGSADYVIEALKRYLASDYREQLKELDSVPWTFDYVLDEFRMDRSNLVCLSVGPRFTGPDLESGSISYGKRIFRIGEDEFLFPSELG